MTQDEMIEMAKRSGWQYATGSNDSGYEPLWAFGKLVAQHEREACANIAHQWSKREDDVGGYIEAAIRARGQALAEKSSDEIETIVYKYSTLYGRRPND